MILLQRKSTFLAIPPVCIVHVRVFECTLCTVPWYLALVNWHNPVLIGNGLRYRGMEQLEGLFPGSLNFASRESVTKLSQVLDLTALVPGYVLEI